MPVIPQLIAMLLMGTALTACAAGNNVQTNGLGSTPSASSDTLTPPGAAFTESVGQTFQVVLQSAGAGGYQWHLDTGYDTAMLNFLGEHPGQLPPNPMAGQFAPEVFEFRGQAAGSTSLHFSQYRSWEGPSQATQTALHPVTVH